MAGHLTDFDKKTIEKWIHGGAKSFTLLYSFMNDGAVDTTFHLKCDNKGPTLTVIYNTKGSAYGGYTEKSWTSDAGVYYPDTQAFLFRLKYEEKYYPKKFPSKDGNNAIYCYSAYGPTFGGHDIYSFSGTLTMDGTAFTLNGSTNFGNAYDMSGIVDAQISNGLKTVTDLEVYQVTDLLLTECWRITPEWTLKSLQEIKREIEDYTPPNVKEARILFIGPVGAGKSSFFNTVASVFRGHVTGQACSGSADQSITSKYRMYQIRGSPYSQPLKLRLCDTQGLEENSGIDAQELNYLLEGHVPDGYQFNPLQPISSEIVGFIPSPRLDQKIHCVCIVIDGSTASVLSERMLERIKSLQIKVRQRGIPQVILLTKVDSVCSHVQSDVRNVFSSIQIQDLLNNASQIFGVPRYQVLPTKNYEKELEVDDNISLLSLITLRQIVRAAEDFLFNFLDTDDAKRK